MATTTPNYGWDVPTSTDYVKDGATAIETLGDDIDASLYSITSGKNVGLVHIGTTSFTSATNILLDNIFTTDFDTYEIRFAVTHSASVTSTFQFVNTDGTNNATSNYNFSIGTFNPLASPNVGVPYTGSGATTSNSLIYEQNESAGNMVFTDPALAKNTKFYGQGMVSSRVLTSIGGRFNGTTAFRGIRFTITGGNITGNMRVYGLRNS
jgi:hypothetical protein